MAADDRYSPAIISLRCPTIRADNGVMQTLPISAVKNRLNELVDAANVTREQIMITKNGSPAAVLIGADEWESLQEILSWVSQPGVRDSIRVARAEIASGEGLSEEQIRAEFRQPSAVERVISRRFDPSQINASTITPTPPARG